MEQEEHYPRIWEEVASELVSCGHGVHIPQVFFSSNNFCSEENVTDGAWCVGSSDELARIAYDLGRGPDGTNYYESWASLVDNAELNEGGNKYTLHETQGGLYKINRTRLEELETEGTINIDEFWEWEMG